MSFLRRKPRETRIPAAPSWPASVPVISIDEPKVFQQRIRPGVSGRTAAGSSFMLPAAVIGWGRAGDLLCRYLVQQPGVPASLAAGSLQMAELVRADARYEEAPGGVARWAVPPPTRLESRDAWLETFNKPDIDRIDVWLMNYASNQSTVRPKAFLCGSLQDPVVNLIPRLLQKIAWQECFSAVFVLATLGGPAGEGGLREDLAAAALRELTRFMQPCDHVLPQSYQPRPILPERELLHHVFVIGGGFEGARAGSYEETTQVVLCETAYTLLHPSSQPIHERLVKVRLQLPKLAEGRGLSLVSSLSSVTLRAPLAELQEYVAARRTREFLFEEGNGFVRGTGGAWHIPGRDMHPAIAWLLAPAASGLPAADSLIDAQQLQTLFRNLVTNSLNMYLNGGGSLGGAFDTLQRTEDALRASLANLRAADARTTAALRSVGEAARGDLGRVRSGVEAWQRSLGLKARAASQPAASNPFDYLMDRSLAERRPAEASLREIASGCENQALERLRAVHHNQYSYSVLDLQDDEQLEEFYRQVANSPGVSSMQEALQERLGWWARWDDEEFKLCVVFLPEEWEPSAARRTQQLAASYAVGRCAEVHGAVRELQRAAVASMARHLTDDYFDQLVAQVGVGDRLADVDHIPFLKYESLGPGDDDFAEELRSLSTVDDARMGFCIGRDKSQVQRIVEQQRLFAMVPKTNITEAGGNEPTRVTAMVLENYIPLRRVAAFAAGRAGAPYMFPEEKQAARYERESDIVPRKAVLSPRLVATLHHAGLVQLFFRAVNCGVISLQARVGSDFGRGNRQWCIEPIGGFSGWPLSEGDELEDFWKAYRNFVLTFPAQPERANRDVRTARNPFQAGKRAAYFNEVSATCRRQQEAKKQRSAAEAMAKALSESSSRLLQQLAWIMRVELGNLYQPLDDFREPLFD